MGSNRLRQALTDLQERFRELRRKGKLGALLVETPVLLRPPELRLGTLPGGPGKWGGTTWSRTYRSPIRRLDDTGKPAVAAMPSIDAEGNPQLNEEGQPLDFDDCGASRVVQLEGKDSIWKRFNELATDAGHLLESAPSIQKHFPPETLKLADAPLRWICALFDLAWKRIDDSPLRPETDKSVHVEIDPDIAEPDFLVGDVPADILDRPRKLVVFRGVKRGQRSGTAIKLRLFHNPFSHRRRLRSWPKPQPWYRDILLAEWSRALKEHRWKAAFRGVTDPPEWFSTLADVVQASVDAINVLLDDIPAEVDGAKPKKPRSKKSGPSKQAQSTDLIVLAALLSHHRVGSPEPNKEAATQQELMQLSKLEQSTVSRTMKKLFGPRGMAAYKGVCAAETIEGFLKKKEDGTTEVETTDDLSPAHRPHFGTKNSNY